MHHQPAGCRRFYRPEPIAKEMLCAGYFQGQKGFCEVGPLASAPGPTLRGAWGVTGSLWACFPLSTVG